MVEINPHSVLGLRKERSASLSIKTQMKVWLKLKLTQTHFLKNTLKKKFLPEDIFPLIFRRVKGRMEEVEERERETPMCLTHGLVASCKCPPWGERANLQPMYMMYMPLTANRTCNPMVRQLML